MRITCNQFEALMHFYVNNELKPELKNAFENHLLSCEKCQDKYNAFKHILSELRHSYTSLTGKNFVSGKNDSEDVNINTLLSAYADNELELNENIKLRKYIISKPVIRKKLENIYSLKELLNTSFKNTKPEEDYSNKIIKQVYQNKTGTKNVDILYTLLGFLVLSIVFAIMLIFSV